MVAKKQILSPNSVWNEGRGLCTRIRKRAKAATSLAGCVEAGE
jgi:hypothetical protein